MLLAAATAIITVSTLSNLEVANDRKEPQVSKPVETKTEPIPQQTNSDVARLVAATFGQGHIMLRVAACESKNRQFNLDGSVLRGEINPKDVGIFQINEYYHLEASQKAGYDIYTIEGNIGYAQFLYSTSGTTPWDWSKPCWGK